MPTETPLDTVSTSANLRDPEGDNRVTTLIEAPPINPLGSTSQEAARRRYRRSAGYREHHARWAPYREIARVVILARADREWTQKQLADALGTTNTAVSRIESGRHGVSLDTLQKLARVLNVTFTIGPDNPAVIR